MAHRYTRAMIPNSFLAVLIRFVHIGSVAGLVGAALYARLAALPALNALPPTERMQAAKGAQVKFRGILYTLLLLIILSGIYNYVGGQPHGSRWQMWFGIKMLLVLHILASAILWAISPSDTAAAEAKNKRRLAGMAISGFLAILIANYMHYLTLHGQ
jgi:hypothetical protein